MFATMKKEPTIENFGKRLATLRKAKGLTQKVLGEMVGVSNRVIAYYEKETKYPPAHLISPLAKALSTTIEELLGVKGETLDFDTSNAALWRKLKIVEKLPKKDQKAVLHYIEMIAKNREVV